MWVGGEVDEGSGDKVDGRACEGAEEWEAEEEERRE